MCRQYLLQSILLHYVALESQNHYPNSQNNDVMMSPRLSCHPLARLAYLIVPVADTVGCQVCSTSPARLFLAHDVQTMVCISDGLRIIYAVGAVE